MPSTLTVKEITKLKGQELQQEYLKMTMAQRADLIRASNQFDLPEVKHASKRPRGRQRVVHNPTAFNVRLNREFLAKFDALVKEEGKSREAKIRELMDIFVEAHGAGAGLPTAEGLDRT